MPTSAPPRTVLILLGAMLVTGALVRLYLAQGQDYPSYDGCYYLNLARDMVARGQVRYSSFPPGFPAVVAVAMVGLGTDSPEGALRAAQLVNSVAGLLLAGLTFLLVRRALGSWSGLLAAAIVLLLPLALRHSFSDLSQLTYACALIGGLLLYERGRRAAAGFVLGASYLIRPEGLVVLGALAIREAWQRRWPTGLVLGGLVWVLPYVVYLFVQTGQLLPSSKWGFLEASVETVGPGGMLGLYARNTAAMVRMLPAWLGIPLFLLAVLGVASRGGAWRLGLVPMLLLPLFTFAMELGYWLPVLPLLLLAAGYGGVELVELARAGRWRRVLRIALVTAAMGGLLMASWRPMRELRVVDESFPGLRATGRWLRTQVPRDALVAAGKPYVSFWAGCQFVRIPGGMTTEAIIRWCQVQRADYLVANHDVALRFLPGLLPLATDPPDSLGGLRRIGSFTVEGRPGQTTQLYRVIASP